MVETKECSFCGNKIEPGTGKMYIKNDGQVLTFCGSKCEKNMMELDRKARETRWTQKHMQEKALRTYTKEGDEEKKVIKKKSEE